MSALEKLREDMWGEKYTRTTRNVIQKKAKKKPVGFYKDKKGTTRPITSGSKRSKQTKVITRYGINIPSSRRGAHGWEIDFPSRSSSKIYTTTFWTEDYKQFKEGDLSCNCPGWRYRRTCKHVKEVEQMAGVKAIRSLTKPRNTRVANASSATRLKFDKAVKGAQETGLKGFHMDNTFVIALLVDVNEAVQGAGKDIVKFIQSLPRSPDASYRRITQASLGKSIKDAHDPKDREHLYIGDTTYKKEPVKVALRTLGGRNIRVYSMGTDQPVLLINAADEAVLIAPYVTVDSSKGNDDVLHLKDIAS